MVNRSGLEPSPDTSGQVADMSAGELLSELRQVEHSICTAQRPETVPTSTAPSRVPSGLGSSGCSPALAARLRHGYTVPLVERILVALSSGGGFRSAGRDLRQRLRGRPSVSKTRRWRVAPPPRLCKRSVRS